MSFRRLTFNIAFEYKGETEIQVYRAAEDETVAIVYEKDLGPESKTKTSYTVDGRRFTDRTQAERFWKENQVYGSSGRRVDAKHSDTSRGA